MFAGFPNQYSSTNYDEIKNLQFAPLRPRFRRRASAVPNSIQELSPTKAGQKHGIWIKLLN